MKKIMLIIFAVILIISGGSQARARMGYNYVSANDLKGWLTTEKTILIVDIQVKDEFKAHHIKGALETNAYPVKSEAERHTLDPALHKIQARKFDKIVVVCPRGKGGAKRAYDYLEKHGTPEDKLVILTGGMGGWPYKEWVAKN